MDAPRSLMLVTVDCLRADHTGFLGYERHTTPFLDSLAVESMVFRNAIVAGAPTYYSFPAIMASRHSLALGRDVVGLAPDEPTIATALNQSGYATAAFLAGNPYLSPRFGYSAGFDTFRDFLQGEAASLPDDVVPEEMRSDSLRRGFNRRLADICHKFGPLGAVYDELYFQYGERFAAPPAKSFDDLRRFPAAGVIVDQACDWLSEIGGQPFFLWLHFMDPHAPYYPSRDALDLMGSTRLSPSRARYLNSLWNRGGLSLARLQRHREEILALYDAGIRWVDLQVARLVERLRDLGLWDNSVLALTADHGEEFLDHGGRYHPPSKVTEERIHVPLLLRAPDSTPMEPSTPFSLLDLAPTLLDAVDAQLPGSFRGRSRWTQLQAGRSWEDPAIVECVTGCTNPFHRDKRLGPRILAVREARYKLVFDFKTSSEELFDLEADPGELRPLPSNVDQPARRRLLERARRHLSNSAQFRDPQSCMAARLRDLRLEWADSAKPALL
jgi:arylsulfatase A-like enzyme